MGLGFASSIFPSGAYAAFRSGTEECGRVETMPNTPVTAQIDVDPDRNQAAQSGSRARGRDPTHNAGIISTRNRVTSTGDQLGGALRR